MMLTLATNSTDTETDTRRFGLAVVQLNDQLWRVTRLAGDVVGYIERFRAPGGQRYRAKRFFPGQRRFLIDGEFWAMDDALECFRVR